MGTGNPSTKVMLGRVKRVVQGALANADVPFHQVVSDLSVPRSAAYSPIFQVMFIFGDASFDADAAEHVDPEEVCLRHVCASPLLT